MAALPLSPSVLFAISEPRRVEILRLVWKGEVAAGEIARAFDVTFGAISQHLRVLKDAGLVEARKEGRHRFYRARVEELGPLAPMLEAMWRDRLSKLKELAEARERHEQEQGQEHE